MDRVVLQIAFKEGVFKLVERISKVFAAMVKHVVMFFSRISVRVG
jgi:hypothetical protein